MGSIDIVPDPRLINFGIIAMLYGIYLLIAFSIGVLNIILQAPALYSFRRKRVSFDGDMAKDAMAIAKGALKGRIENASDMVASKLSENAAAIDTSALLFKVDCIDARFQSLWETCHARGKASKALATLTVVLSMFLGSWLAMDFFSSPRFESSSNLQPFAGGYWQGVFMYLTVGFFVAAFLYAASFIFQGVLSRRRKVWNYAKVRFREELSLKKGDNGI
jgi:hypothetical protein